MDSVAGGIYTISSSKKPHFMSHPQEITLNSLIKTSFDISFINATPGGDGDFSWTDAQIKISGPSQCNYKFKVKI